MKENKKSELLAPSPPMGWNSWNWWGKGAINEKIVIETIDAIADSGLRDAGYEYVVVDGGWRGRGVSERITVSMPEFKHLSRLLRTLRLWPITFLPRWSIRQRNS